MTVEADLIAEFVADIWRVVVGRPPLPAPAPPVPAADWLTGWVQITGAWRGTVSVSGPPAVMRSLAAAVLGVPAERVKECERADAVGELAAMIAGNLKAILPPPCYLSKPAVAAADAAEPEGVARRRVLSGGFLDPAGPFVVTVAETSRSGVRRRTPERPSGVSPLSDCEASGRYPRALAGDDGAVVIGPDVLPGK